MMDFKDDLMRSLMFASVQGMHSQSFSKVLCAALLLLVMMNFTSIKKYYEKHFNNGGRDMQTIELVGSIIEDHYSSRRMFSKRFISLLHYIIKHQPMELDKNRSKSVKSMIEICTHDMDQINDTQKDNLIVMQEEPVQITDDISCIFSIDRDDNMNEKTRMKYTNISVKVYSYKKSTKELKQFLDDCVRTYDEHVGGMLNESLYYFVLDNTGETHHFKKIKFTSDKTFDNVFFKEKELLKERLNYFRDNSDAYKKFGVPYTFGILMHGDPGTGKTSTIKAIANYMKRHIIAIPLFKVKDIGTLTNLFLNVDIDGVPVPFDKRIYVFEEIDCNGMNEITKQRGSEKNTKSELEDFVELLNDECVYGAEKKQLLKAVSASIGKTALGCSKDNNTSDITLGSILELLDGIVETPGRIMVVTTNHPDNLDSALIRPGRIDMNIHFTKTTKEDLVHMFKLWYNVDLDDEDKERLQEYKFSHAEVCQIFFANASNSSATLSALITRS